MTPERWRQIKDVFADALDQPESTRDTFLTETCGADRELRSEVDRLLAQAGATLRSPALSLAPRAPALEPGMLLSQYRVDGKIGEGGMGSVYRAFDTRLQRKVALKLLPTGQSEGPGARDRLMSEARAASGLNHPNIVTVYEIGTGDGLDYIAMEYVEGRPLGQVIPPGGLPLRRALGLAIEIADALAQAHSGGVVHRDLKPGNVMVTRGDHIKLLDFGLAQREHVAEDEITTAEGQGDIAGTPAYMSPEQAEGRKADQRSDVFSFGAVLYEMLTGRRPFTGSSSTSVMASVLRDEPGRLFGVPVELDRIVERCLRKDPDQRFQSMQELQTLLEDLRQDLQQGKARTKSEVGPPHSTVFRKRFAIAVVVMGGLGAANHWLRPGRPTGAQPFAPVSENNAAIPGSLPAASWDSAPKEKPPVSTRVSSPVLSQVPPFAPPWSNQGAVYGQYRLSPIVTAKGMVRDPTFSQDGRRIAFSWNGEGRPNIYVSSAGTSQQVLRLTSAGSDEGATWSPHGSRIAFRRDNGKQSGIYMVPPEGGQETLVALSRPLADEMLPQMSWTPDGNWLAAPEMGAGQSTVLTLFSVHEQGMRQLAWNESGVVHAPAISPNGRYLAYASGPNVYACDIYLLPLNGDALPGNQQAVKITRQAGYVRGIAWMKDSRSVVYASGQKYDATTALWRLSILPPGEPERLDMAGEQVRHPDVARAGNRMAFTRMNWDSDIWRWQRGGKPAGLLFGASSDFDPVYSPDGKKIAYSSRSSGAAEIWTCDRGGANRVQLTKGIGRDQGAPAWSPDGSRLAFESLGSDGRRDVFVMDAKGGKADRLTPMGSDAFAPAWSRDGASLYFTARGEGGEDIWRMASNGGEAQKVTDRGGLYAAESADGANLYYTKALDVSQPGHRTALYVRPVAGGAEKKLLGDVQWYGYTVTGKGIYYISGSESGANSLVFYDFGSGQTFPLAAVPNTPFHRITASPDGGTVLFGALKTPEWSLMMIENFQ